MHRALNKSLLGGVSLLALMLVSDLGEARTLTPGSNSVVPTAAAQQAAIAAAQQAAAAASQAQASLARAAAALNAARQLQLDAAAAARAQPSSVPNGLTTGGLMPAGGTASDPLAGINADRSKWIGGDLPKQTTEAGQVKVDINQTQQKGIFYWDTFNVGASTTVNFKQNASDWIALNRVLDPTAAPSQIFGQINAPGTVYLINRNGIIFGPGSQTNVHTLIASSLDIGKLGTDLTARDQFFLNTGIANLNSFSDNPVAGIHANPVAGDVAVERGASITANITTDLVPLGSPGSVYLFGANVSNSGSITVPTGEVAMVAARAIDLIPNGYSALPPAVLGQDTSGNTLKLRGTEFRIAQFGAAYNASGYAKSNQFLPGTGAVTDDGLIEASRGIVIMNGDTVAINNPKDAGGNSLKDAAGNLVQGVISVDTSIDRNSMVMLRAATSVSMNGVITSRPFDDGAAPLPSGTNSGSSVQSFTPAYIEMTAQTSVAVGSSGLVSAPSAQVSLRAIDLGSQNASAIYQSTGFDPVSGTFYGLRLFNQGGDPTNGQGGNLDVTSSSVLPKSVLLAPGAIIDVAGLQNVELPASYNFVSFSPRAEFADMPLQRGGPLYGQTLWIDIRASGKRSDGTSWVGTPLADASGYVNNVGRSIYQLMTLGGNVVLKTDLSAQDSGVQTAGSTINLAGGSVNFLPGMVNTTRLLGADGRIYDMANADPNMTYLGIAGQFTVNHAHWGVTETWSTGTQTFAPGYTEGHDAGGLSITTAIPSLQGDIYFGSLAGARQINSGALPLQGSFALTTPSSVQVGSSPSAQYTAQSAVTTTLSADTLSGYGLSALSITANDLVVSSGSTLNLAPGGSFSAKTGGAIDIAGTVSAPGGAIDFSTDRVKATGTDSNSLFGLGAVRFKAPTDQTGAGIAANVFVEGTLDVSGRFANDTGRLADASGPAFINGGAISITTNKSSTAGRDTTGSILLGSGSVLDVSSGGYVSQQGQPKNASSGVMAGKAGSISLVLYQGLRWRDPIESVDPVRPSPGTSKVAVLQLDGTLLGHGFESNGSLRLGAADVIRLGGTLYPGETSAIRIGGAATTLPLSLLNGGGFGAYTIESVADDYSGAAATIIVSPGTSLTLQQQNLPSLADYRGTATGTRLGQQVAPGFLPDDQRKPVDLALKADNITFDTGTTLATDPKAKITFGAINIDHTLTASDPTRNVPAQSVELRGRIIDHGGTVFINATKTHLAAQASVDLSGSFVANSLFGVTRAPAISGTYVPGGAFTVEAGFLGRVNTLVDPANLANNKYYYAYSPGPGYVAADAGATLDVSGSAGPLQLQDGRGNISSTWAWTDAGTVSADVAGFAWGGSFITAGGRYVGTDGIAHADARANNGTFILGGGGIFLRQDTTDVKNNLSAPAALIVSADQLAPFDNVFLYSAASIGGAARFFNELPAYNRLSGSGAVAEAKELPGSIYNIPLAASNFGTLTISGSLDWKVRNGLRIAAGNIASNDNNAGNTVAFDAPYVALTGLGSAAASGNNRLDISGQTIDVEGASFSGFAQANLISSGDIRLSTPKVSNTVDPASGASNYPGPASLVTLKGNLSTKGDLLLQAQRIYPVSAVDFTITTPGNVKFAAPAASNTAIPLSAGGGLTVVASTIDQAGNLFAPLGTIRLGNLDATLPTASAPIVTSQVILEPGSLTSVTLADTIVPYGATADGTSWYYNANLDALAQPPSKGLVLAAASVTRSHDSTIDLRGGGDVQAMEWIQGKGGSRDTLTTTPSGQTVYALLPSQSDPVSAFDIHFTAARSADGGKTVIAGDAYPLAGTQITLDGGNGIPAGVYTLEPAHYATVPGALRVVSYGDNLGRNISSGTTLPDGTVLVTGHTTQSTAPGKQTSGQTLFAVQTGAIWQQYSEYSLSRANSYFSQQAAKRNAPAPRLPMDAGRLAVIAQRSILLDGAALTQPGLDSSGNTGRGGELDISAPKLAVVSHTQFANNDVPAGYVGLDVGQLNGFESILIGGQRSDFSTGTSTGTVIIPTAANVMVDTRGDVFSAPEILLVTQQVGQWKEFTQTVNVGSVSVLVDFPVYQPVDGSGSVTIKAGSIIETTGVVHAGSGRNYIVAADVRAPVPTGSYIVAADVQAPVTAASIAAALGGSLETSGPGAGTVIDGADLTKLPAFWFVNGNQSAPAAVPNKATLASVPFYANGGVQQPGRGGLFAASNDPSLVLSGPTVSGVSSPALTIKFADVSSGQVPGAAAAPVTGTVTLPGGDTSNSGQVTVEAGARISTDTLTLQATAKTNAIAINTNDLHARQVNLTAPTIAIGANSPVSDKGLVLAASNAQFADVQGLALKALSGPITAYGDFNPGPRSLTLDASGLAIGTEALNPGNSLNVRAQGLLVFPQGTPGATTVQFNVGVTVTSGSVDTTYPANTPITLAANSRVRPDGAGTLTVSGATAVTLLRDTTVTASDSISLKNSGSGTFTGTAGNGNTLALVTKEIDLGGGAQTIAGFSQVDWTASNRVLIAGPGSMTLGLDVHDRADLTVTTPNILVAAATAAYSERFALTSSAGNILVVDSVPRQGVANRPADSAETGGSLVITASNITIASTIQAQAGTIALNAIAGDVTLDAGAYLAAGGYKKTLVDVDTYFAGGKVTLYADLGAPFLPAGTGRVITNPNSVIDVAQVVDPAHPAGGMQGYGGEIDVSALRGDALLAGILRGTGGPGVGGRFKLDTAGSADLTALADNLLSGGITGAIDIHTRTGNLDLAQGHTLKAQAITLTADDPSLSTPNQFGRVTIEGTIDASGYAGKTADGSGQAGGQVGLFGRNAVVLTNTSQILARTGGSDVTLNPGTAYTLPSKVVWFANGTGTDTVTFSVSGRYTTDGGTSYTTFAANSPIQFPQKNTAVLLDSPGRVSVGGSAPVSFFASAHDDERGGDVKIGTSWAAAGNIDLQAGSKIDVSGGIKGGLLGGTVTLRAPLDGHDNLKIAGLDTTINGARAVNVQGFVTIDTSASSNLNGIDGSTLTTKSGAAAKWDGYIDPAGLVTSKGITPDFGSWANVTGEQLNVTPGAYTAPPNISVLPSTPGAQPISGSTFVDSTGATFYQVTDPVTGTTFRSSLQVVSINVTNGGSYTSPPTVTLTAANGTPLPGWGKQATAAVNMAFNDIDVSGISGLANNSNLNGKSVNLLNATGMVIGTGHVVVTSGAPTKVVVDTSTNTSTVPTQLFVRTSFFGGTLYSSGFSATMRVAGATLVANAGYSGGVNVAFSSGNAAATAIMGAAVTVTGVTRGYASAADLPTVTVADNQTGARVSFAAQTTSLNGATDESGAFIPNISSNFIPLATSRIFKGNGDAAVLAAVGAYQPHQLLYTDVLANFVEGHGLGSMSGYGFAGIETKLQSGLVAQLGGNVVHLQPGIELVNTSTSINSGNITVASNWNLASGTAYNLQTGTDQNKNPFQYFDPTQSYIGFNYRLSTDWHTFDAGNLTLRAGGNINVNASISDGFFQSGNYLDPNYLAWVAKYVVPYNNSSKTNTRVIDPYPSGLYAYYLNDYSGSAAPIAPYSAAGNTISPTAQDLAVADLFPHTLRVCTSDCSQPNIITVTAPSSWSYNFTAGADTASANPMARRSLATAQDAKNGNVIVDGHSSYTQSLVADVSQSGSTSVTVSLPTMVRTGTGDIAIAAAQNVSLNDTTAPGVIYAAGVNAAKLADPSYSTVNGSVVAGNANGFFEPTVLAYGNNGLIAGVPELYYGPPTAAAFPERGGDVRIDAQQDIIGYNSEANKVLQYYQPWLLADIGLTPAGSGIKAMGAGVFAPSATQIASQTAWWIQYGSFRQGFLSAGGNVSVIAGGDLKDVSVSLPTTGRVSGGLSAASTPLTHIYDSGNMVVEAGGNILGGSFYEGSGHARIVAGRKIDARGTLSRYASSRVQLTDYPLLAVDTGQIEVVAGGSAAIAGVVNPAELHAQRPSFANPLETSNSPSQALYMDTYGPDSKVRLLAETGDLTIGIAPTAIGESNGKAIEMPAVYPASFEAIALNGSLLTTGITPTVGVRIPTPGIVLSPSLSGTFQLLAQDSIDLSFNYPKNTSALLDDTPRPFISAGAALINTAFDPFQPNNGFDGAFAGAVLAHQVDAGAGIDSVARIYAATGDIVGTGSYGKRTKNDPKDAVYQQRIEINRPTRVYAGEDIVDLNIIVQNIQKSDVSSIGAGRNIYYTGFNNAGGLQVAGPGFFVVQAGGDIGPFLPASHDTAGEAKVQEGIASVGNGSATVGNIYVSAVGGSVGVYDQGLLGPRGNPRRNALLTSAAGTARGADVIALFGTRFGMDFQAVIDAYIDPANAAKVDHNYIAELRDFLVQIGKPAGATDAATVFSAFKALPAELQQVFVERIFFAELKAIGINQQNGAAQYQPGYQMINTLFPSKFGYTANALGGGTNGANQLVKTGDLNLLHGTIQTRLGGDISLFGPGGNILVGSLAAEPNSNLKLSDLGILSLGTGDINTFTDQSVLVNASRVLTTQGGDVLMWSSNGNLDAGRGSKTSLSAPALQVLFDQNDYQSVDLGGFVTGAGIGTLQASSVAKESNLYLLAPRGVIDAGTAGIRVSGNAVFAATVINNASNIQVQGTSTGVPVVSVPNIGALTSGSNTAGAAAKTADTPTAAGGGAGDRASVFIVEVVGYGGGEGQASSGGQGSSADEQSDSESSEKRKR